MEGVRENPRLEKTPSEAIQEGLDGILEFETAENFIDKGGIGKVYALPNGFCMKLVEDRHNSPNRHLFDLGNTAYQEARFQEQMSHTPFAGKTRVPRLVGSKMSGISDGRHMIIMERLFAVNLQHIINRKATLPDTFDIDAYFTDLERFIDHMHQVEGIVHNDLFARNIMVDTATAQPYVIDFGRAISLHKIPSEYQQNRLKDKDWKNLDKVYNDTSSLQE